MKSKQVSTGPGLRLSTGALLVAGAFPAAGLAAPAARVEFAIGDVQVVASGGQVRAARKGTEVNTGETVSTNAGRAQLRFSDGAYVSLQPQSEFRIDDYRFEGKADGSERGIFSLLKGGLRTITGLVGRTNKQNYRVNTAVATIGIRGTEYTIAYTNSISGSVGEGEIEVCTTRCVPFGSGESFFVPSAESTPQLTGKKTDLPPTQPDENQPALIAGNEVGPGGAPVGLLFTGTQDMNWYLVDSNGSTNWGTGPVVFRDDGSAAKLCSSTTFCGIEPTNVTDVAADGIFTWGRGFSASSSEMLHYISGLKSPNQDLLALKTGQITMEYAFTGGTRPTAMLPGGELAVGSLSGGVARIEYGAPAAIQQGGLGLVNLAINGSMFDQGFTVQGSNLVLDSSGSFFSAFSSGGGACAVTGGNGCSIAGLVGGAGGRGLGAVYEFQGEASAQRVAVTVTGSAAFQAPPKPQ